MAEWRWIAGYEWKYAVSDGGKVRSFVVSPRGRLMKLCLTNGYPMVQLGGKLRSVHRLVAEAFHGPCPAGHETRHLDGSKDNNRADNLAWGSRSENALDRARHGRGIRLSWADVLEIRALRGYFPQRALADRFGCARSCISRIQTGRRRAEA